MIRAKCERPLCISRPLECSTSSRGDQSEVLTQELACQMTNARYFRPRCLKRCRQVHPEHCRWKSLVWLNLPACFDECDFRTNGRGSVRPNSVSKVSMADSVWNRAPRHPACVKMRPTLSMQSGWGQGSVPERPGAMTRHVACGQCSMPHGLGGGTAAASELRFLDQYIDAACN